MEWGKRLRGVMNHGTINANDAAIYGNEKGI